jgi:hypothetical protein
LAFCLGFSFRLLRGLIWLLTRWLLLPDLLLRLGLCLCLCLALGFIYDTQVPEH